jgi:hypothetical protein
LNYKHRLDEIIKYLGKRDLIWLGLRGSDAATLLQIPQFSKVFSIIAPFEANPAISETCLESLQKKRVDPHTYNTDEDRSEEAVRWHNFLCSELSKPSAVLAYRPDKLFTKAYFSNVETLEYFGLLHARQTVFEHKPWVENELKKTGVRTVPWKYYGRHNLPEENQLTAQMPFIIRSDEVSIGGGGNMVIVRDKNKLNSFLPLDYDSLLSISPYLYPNVPLNVNACLFQDGSISLHGPSVQLIGIESCTRYVLGYCGNDFSRIRDLDAGILDELEEMVVQVGKWLASVGYLGVFGVDAIEYKGHVYFSEINPRFQNSSVIAAQLDQELDLPDMYLNQIAAFAGLSAPPHISLRELAKQQKRVSQIICNSQYPQPVFCRDIPGRKHEDWDCLLLPASDVEIVPEGMLFKLLVDGTVTENGQSLLENYGREIEVLNESFFPRIC